jgi:hypothetical protein
LGVQIKGFSLIFGHDFPRKKGNQNI